MTQFLQQLINGIDLGAIYALFAVGFSLIFGVYGIFSLAQGSILAFGMYFGYLAASPLHLGFILSLLAALIFGGILSVVVDQVAFRPLRARGAPQDAAIVTSVGASFIIESALQHVTDTEVKAFPVNLFPGTAWTLGKVSFSLLDIVVVLAAIVLTGALSLALRYTRFGRRIRAVSADPATARLLGIRPGPIYIIVFLLCGAFAGVSGLFLGVTYGTFTYNVGDNYLLIGIAAIVVGGLGSIPGAFVGGLGMGIIQVLTVQYVSSNWSFAGPFIILFLVMIVRPAGLFGKFNPTGRVARA
jgi:branched-chain amino acid transport system permease protein